MNEIVTNKKMNAKQNVYFQSPVLSIIIVNYNVKEYILSCIQSIQDKIDAKRCPYEVIVSDNGSVDGSVDAIMNRFPWVNVIENKANYGFSKANNIGAAKAKGNVLFFLNPDTVIVKGIEEMVKDILDNEMIGEVGPIVLDQYNKLQNSLDGGNIWSNIFIQILYSIPIVSKYYRAHRYKKLIKYVKLASPFSTHWISGAAMLFKKKTLDKIGNFDEGYFLYFEELDFYQKLKKEKYILIINPNAVIIHYGQKSSDEIASYKNILYFIKSMQKYERKYYPRTWWIKQLIVFFTYLEQLIANSIKLLITLIQQKDISNNIAQINNSLYCSAYLIIGFFKREIR